MYEETGPDGKRRYTVNQITAEFGVTRPTLYRAGSRAQAEADFAQSNSQDLWMKIF